MKEGWHLCPEAVVHGMASFLHTHWWQHWCQQLSAWGSVLQCLGALAGQVALLFIEKHGDAWESGKKSGSWSPRLGRAPTLKGRRGAGGWWREICCWGRVQSCPDVQLEGEKLFLVPHNSVSFKRKSSWAFHCGSCCTSLAGHKTNLAWLISATEGTGLLVRHLTAVPSFAEGFLTKKDPLCSASVSFL